MATATNHIRAHRYRPEQFPVAYESFQRMISLPLNARLSDQDVADVIEAVRDVVRTYRR